jgi:PAS domain S-box-containing protein
MNTDAVDREFSMLARNLLDNTSSVIYAKDLEFRFLFTNHQFEKLFHVKSEESFGKTDFDIFPKSLAETFRANDMQVLSSGEAIQCEEIAPHDDGPHQYFSVKFPLRDQHGTIYGIAGISTDVTDQIRAKQEIASLEYQQHLILNSIADGICGLDSAGRISFLNPAAERMLQLSTDELKGKCHSQIVMTRRPNGYLPTATEQFPVTAVLNGETTISVQDASFRGKEGKLFPVEYTVAPIRQANATLGAVLAFRDATARLKQREIEQEIQAAFRIQNSLYPKQMPKIAGFDFSAICIPCSKACGDYFDFIPWGENRLGIAVGDVSGHGLGPALEMVATRAVLRAAMLNESNPAECLARLNQVLVEDLPGDMFVTLFLAALNTNERTVEYSAAGHDAVILFANGDVKRLHSTGTVLGMKGDARYELGSTIALNSGDLMLIATDGLAESLSPERVVFGLDRIIEVLRRHQADSSQEILSAIQTSCENFRECEASRDDITAVAIKAL